MISILSLASTYCYLKISESSEFPWKKVKVGRKQVNFKCTFFQIGTVAFKVSMQYCTASREFILWADETAIITLASPMGTTLQKHCYLWSTIHQTQFLNYSVTLKLSNEVHLWLVHWTPGQPGWSLPWTTQMLITRCVGQPAKPICLQYFFYNYDWRKLNAPKPNMKTPKNQQVDIRGNMFPQTRQWCHP